MYYQGPCIGRHEDEFLNLAAQEFIHAAPETASMNVVTSQILLAEWTR